MTDFDKPIDPKDKKRLLNRGKGVGKGHEPFFRVQELSSSGESVRIHGHVTGRVHHLLSGIELAAFALFDWHQGTLNIREQYSLPDTDTRIICKQLGIKHPQLHGKLKIVTTDLLMDFKNGSQLALAVKPVSALNDERTIEKLQIERFYWEGLGVEWKLFTDREVSKPMKENLVWLRPVLNEANSEAQFDVNEVTTVLLRLSGQRELGATRICARLDDQYGLAPGTHLQVLRYGVARHLINAPIQTSFHDWRCSELTLNPQTATRVSKHAN